MNKNPNNVPVYLDVYDFGLENRNPGYATWVHIQRKTLSE